MDNDESGTASGDPSRAPDPIPEDLQRIAVPGRLRRAPRYRRFVLAGIVVGAVAGLAVVIGLGSDRADVSRATVLPFVVVGLVLLGAVLGALVAVLADRSSRR